jgi:hypothetical protein
MDGSWMRTCSCQERLLERGSDDPLREGLKEVPSRRKGRDALATTAFAALPIRFYITHIMGGRGPGSLAPQRSSA